MYRARAESGRYPLEVEQGGARTAVGRRELMTLEQAVALSFVEAARCYNTLSAGTASPRDGATQSMDLAAPIYLTPEHKQSYQDNGYVVVSGLFSDDEVAA